MAPSLIRRPIFWMLLQPVVLLSVLAASGRMSPRAEADTAGYRAVDLSSWRTAVSSHRTLGYPIFLRLAEAASPAAVPYLQFALYAGSAIALWAGLRRYGFSGGAALGAASTLFYSGFFLYYVPVLLPEAAALSLAIVAVASLAAVAGRGGGGAWAGVTIGTALAYHFRPAYLFLVPLAPLLGLFLLWLRPIEAASNRWRRVGLGLTLASMAPFLFYCGLRWATVGHFGLVSFGGYNAIGIAGQWLTPELAESMPPHLTPLAREMLARERALPNWQRPEGYFAMFANYNTTVVEVALPAARNLYGDDDVVVNARLSDLARRLILARPAAYIRWLLPAAKHGLAQLFEYSILDRLGLVLLVLLAGCEIILLARWRRRPTHPPPARDYFFELHAMMAIALFIAGAKLALVILVEPPIHRYVAAAATFFPACLALAVVDRVCRVRSWRLND